MASTAEAAAPQQWASQYETIYILRPNVEPEEAEKVANRVKEVMDRLDATIVKVDNWGKRKLAYLIKKHSRGIFIYVNYVAMNDVVAELERNLRLLEPVMRYQTIVLEKMIDPSKVEVDPEETEFVAIEKGEEEPELDRAQSLGLAPIERPAPPAAEKKDKTEETPAAEAEKTEEAPAADAEKAEEAPAADAEKAEEAPAAEAEKTEEAPAAEAEKTEEAPAAEETKTPSTDEEK